MKITNYSLTRSVVCFSFVVYIYRYHKLIEMHIKKKDIAGLRTDYTLQHLDEKTIANYPIVQFETWLKQAIDNAVMEPTAMVLSTVNETGQPSSRVVLLKDIQEESFYFFTNYKSKKGQEITQNPNVSLLFFWPELQRQVRVQGVAEKTDARISDEYFASRPKESRIGAISSPQSRIIKNRKELEDKIIQKQKEFDQEENIQRPEYWGGYRVRAYYIEFWQGGANRLHDRIIFEQKDGGWEKYRVAP